MIARSNMPGHDGFCRCRACKPPLARSDARAALGVILLLPVVLTVAALAVAL